MGFGMIDIARGDTTEEVPGVLLLDVLWFPLPKTEILVLKHVAFHEVRVLILPVDLVSLLSKPIYVSKQHGVRGERGEDGSTNLEMLAVVVGAKMSLPVLVLAYSVLSWLSEVDDRRRGGSGRRIRHVAAEVLARRHC